MHIAIVCALTCILVLAASYGNTIYGNTNLSSENSLSSVNPGSINYSSVKTHHSEDGFRNRYPHPGKNSFWKWQWDRLRKGVPSDPKEGYGFPVLRPDVAFLKTNRDVEDLAWPRHVSIADRWFEHHDGPALDRARFTVLDYRTKATGVASNDI